MLTISAVLMERNVRDAILSAAYVGGTLGILSMVYHFLPHSHSDEKTAALGICIAMGTLLTVFVQIKQGASQITLGNRQLNILQNQDKLLYAHAKLYAYCANPVQVSQNLGANTYQPIPFQINIFNDGTRVATTYRLRVYAETMIFELFVGTKSLQAKSTVVVASQQKGNTYDFDFEHRVYPGEQADGPMLQFRPTQPGTHTLKWRLTFDDGITGGDELRKLSTVTDVLIAIDAEKIRAVV